MAFIPPIGSTVAFQSQPSSLLVGASAIGLTPVAVTNTPSISGTVNVGNNLVASISGTVQVSGNPSISGTINVGTLPSIYGNISGSVAATITNTNLNVSGSVVAFQGSGWSGSIAATIQGTPNVNTAGSVVAFQGTSPWVTNWQNSSIITIPTGSIITVWKDSSVLAGQFGTRVSSLVSTVPSSVIVGTSIFGQLPAGTAPLGSVAVLQGTSPWNIAGSVAATITNTTINVSGSVIGFQGTSPWVVNFQNSSLLAGQIGTRVSSLVSTIPSSVIVGASIFGQLPAGTAVLGSVAALQGTLPWAVAGSVVAFQAGTQITSISGVGGISATSSVYAVLSSLTTISVLNANAARIGATIYNAAGTPVFLKLGTAVTTSVYTTQMPTNSYYELPFGWTGVVAGISASNAGIINVTELT